MTDPFASDGRKTPPKPFTIEELRAFLTGKLGKHELPAALEFVDELPRTSVGKLSRHELRMQFDIGLEFCHTVDIVQGGFPPRRSIRY